MHTLTLFCSVRKRHSIRDDYYFRFSCAPRGYLPNDSWELHYSYVFIDLQACTNVFCFLCCGQLSKIAKGVQQEGEQSPFLLPLITIDQSSLQFIVLCTAEKLPYALHCPLYCPVVCELLYKCAKVFEYEKTCSSWPSAGQMQFAFENERALQFVVHNLASLRLAHPINLPFSACVGEWCCFELQMQVLTLNELTLVVRRPESSRRSCSQATFTVSALEHWSSSNDDDDGGDIISATCLTNVHPWQFLQLNCNEKVSSFRNKTAKVSALFRMSAHTICQCQWKRCRKGHSSVRDTSQLAFQHHWPSRVAFFFCFCSLLQHVLIRLIVLI